MWSETFAGMYFAFVPDQCVIAGLTVKILLYSYFDSSFYTCIAFTKSYVHAYQPFIVDAFSKADTKISIGGFQVRVRVVGFTQFLA